LIDINIRLAQWPLGWIPQRSRPKSQLTKENKYGGGVCGMIKLSASFACLRVRCAAREFLN